MNILLTHVYSSSNNGDAAILSAQISELRRVFGNPRLHILTVDKIPSGYTFDGVPVSNALMYGAVAPGRSKLRKLLFAGVMMSYTMLWAACRRWLHISLPLPRSWQDAIRQLTITDIQVCIGGGYLRAKNDHVSTVILLLLFHQIWLAHVLQKPIYLYAQSFGPYPKKLQRWVAARSLRQADLILARESTSAALLQGLGVSAQRIIQVPDAAFLFVSSSRNNLRKMLGISGKRTPILGITVRSWLKSDAQKAYERAVADFMNEVRQKHPRLQIVVIPQVTSEQQNDDDRQTGRRIQKLVKTDKSIHFLDQKFNHYEIRSLYKQLDYLVSTRFHPAIFALTDRVPTIAIEYEHKTSGIMHDLALDEWVMKMEDVTAKNLLSLFEKLLRQRATYVRHLQKNIPPYTARASRSANLIKQAYEHSGHAAGRTAPQESHRRQSS